MNEKERIIELVRQNIITMDEALRLLEAGNTATGESEISLETENEIIEETEADYTEEVEQLLEQITERLSQLEQMKSTKEEALLIATQRYRELEILAELDTLSEELSEQQKQFADKKVTLSNEINDLDEEMKQLKQQQATFAKEQVKQYSENVKRDVADFVNSTAHSSHNLSKAIGEGLKGFLSNFKTVKMEINVPWIKTSELDHTWHFSDNIDKFKIDILSGDITIQESIDDTVTVEGDFSLFGADRQLDDLLADNPVKVEDGALSINFPPTCEVNMTLSLPAKQYAAASIKTVNGDITIQDLNANKQEIFSHNGDIHLQNIQAEKAKINAINGDIEVEDVTIDHLKVSNVNGDIDINYDIQTLDIDSVNSDVNLTKSNTSEAEINVRVVSGDIEATIPANCNLINNSKSTFGDVVTHALQANPASEHTIALTLATKSGDIDVYHP